MVLFFGFVFSVGPMCFCRRLWSQNHIVRNFGWWSSRSQFLEDLGGYAMLFIRTKIFVKMAKKKIFAQFGMLCSLRANKIDKSSYEQFSWGKIFAIYEEIFAKFYEWSRPFAEAYEDIRSHQTASWKPKIEQESKMACRFLYLQQNNSRNSQFLAFLHFALHILRLQYDEDVCSAARNHLFFHLGQFPKRLYWEQGRNQGGG